MCHFRVKSLAIRSRILPLYTESIRQSFRYVNQYVRGIIDSDTTNYEVVCFASSKACEVVQKTC